LKKLLKSSVKYIHGDNDLLRLRLTEKLKRCELSEVDQIPTELVQAGGNTLGSEIHKLIRVNFTGESVNTVNRNAAASKDIGVEVNTELSNMFMSNKSLKA
jgi:hypothetical protein